jgi:outer membrane protein assembly factor BamE (lipoprotein component of BamABCDE complex)
MFITDTGCIIQGLRISQEEVDSMREGSSAKSIRLSQNEKDENGENEL